MHREQAGLGAKADQHEYEGDMHQRWVERLRVFEQHGPEHGAFRLCHHAGRVGVDQHRAIETERHAYCTDDDVFPCRFERGALPVQADQEGGAKRGRFNRYPHHDDVVGGDHHQHGEEEQVEETVIGAKGFSVDFAAMHFVVHVAD